MIRLPNYRAYVLIVAALTVVASGYFTVMGLFDPSGLVPGDATRVYAAYMSARSIVLLGALVVCAFMNRGLVVVLVLNGAVQVLDAVLGAVRGEVAQTVGPLVFAVLLFLAAAAQSRGEAVRGAAAA
ncbi:hypothetical protein ACIBG8_49950 [Nonomuraea sp. NPDC050556]|uniref:hypothetical protein n=1 Tax=Nonomuraea sp. NPDC050556 TaxID=3364369 RepID=UPI0037BC5F21